MKKYLLLIILSLISISMAETLFEVKDSSDNVVLDVSTDGLRVMNMGDTLMVISSSEIKAVLDNSKGLSRSFSVTTSSSKGSENDLMRLTGDSTRFWISDTGSGFGVSKSSVLKGVNPNLLEVSTAYTKMREGTAGERYTDFSPQNIFIGLNSGLSSTGVNNVFVGNQSGRINGSGYSNVFIGPNTGYSNTTGLENVFLGFNAGGSNASGNRNVYIGNEAGLLNTSGDMNICIGDGAGRKNTGVLNVFMGTSAGLNNTNGLSNTFIGNQAGANNTTGNFNTYLGWMAGVNHNGNNNTFIGDFSGMGNYSGDYNVYLGMFAGSCNSDGSGNVFIGYDVAVAGSNKLAIDNFDNDTPLIYGDFSTNALTVNGTLNVTGNTALGGTLTTTSNTSVGGTLTTAGSATINSDAHIVNSANIVGAKGLVIDTDGEATDIPLQIRTTSTAAGWTDTDTKFIVWGDGGIEAKSIKIDGGTAIGKTQAGIMIIGTNTASTYKAVTLTFPSAFSSVPKINVTPVNESGINDIYSATVRNITTTNCVVLICRVDSDTKTWGQNLKVDWFAWE